MKNRLIVFTSIIFALLLTFISCTKKDTQAPKAKLVIATFGGDWGNAQRKVWFDEFEKKYNVKIVDVEYNGDYNLIKSKASIGEWDIIDIEEVEMLRGIKDSLWLPIDYSNIAKQSIIEKAALKYAVGSVAYSILIGFDSEKIKSSQVNGWSDFFSPEKIPGPRGLRTAPQYIIEGMWLAHNKDLRSLYEMDLDKSIKMLKGYFDTFKKQIGKSNIITFETYGQPQDLIKRHTVTMAYGTNGRMMAEKNKGANIGVCWNQSILTIEYYVISKQTKNNEYAQKFIDFILSKDNQANMGRFIPYGPVNKLAYDELSEKEKEQLPTAPNIYPLTFHFDASWWLKNEIKARKMYREFLLLN